MPEGIITENDLIHVLASDHADIDSIPISQIMSSPVEAIHQNEMLYRALARMDRLDIGHLCVVDDNHVPVGVVSQRNLLQYRARGPNMLSDALEIANDTQTLAAAYARVTGVAEQLLDEGLDGSEIARVIATEMQVLTERAACLATDKMKDDGLGEPPAKYTVLVLGSGGRGESLLNADQDNALIYDDTGSDNDEWFAHFGEHMTRILDTAGLPFCSGQVMISNIQWRGTLTDWEQRIQNWLRRGRNEDLLNVDIFFDMVTVDGDIMAAQRLFQNAVESASKTPTFMNLLAQSVLSVSPRFGFFNRLPNKEGRLDLKRDGLLPLVSFARTLAISIGSLSRATPDRLQDLIAVGKLSEGDGERLIQLHKRLLTLILRQQLQDIKNGITPGTRVDLSTFSRKQYSKLVQELRHLNTMVGEIQSLVVH
jgi:DNA polymerase-3 subunit epsilon/CBS domain-containing protein